MAILKFRILYSDEEDDENSLQQMQAKVVNQIVIWI